MKYLLLAFKWQLVSICEANALDDKLLNARIFLDAITSSSCSSMSISLLCNETGPPHDISCHIHFDICVSSANENRRNRQSIFCSRTIFFFNFIFADY